MDKVDKKTRVVVAMSGGVDSSVAAALLKKQGFDVVGVFMKFWHDRHSLGGVGNGENRCCSIKSEKLARLVAKQLEIPFYVLNVEKEFKKSVVDYFLEEYKKGNTPNPCVVCNKEIKFGFLIKKALSLGAEFLATGHYARLATKYEKGTNIRKKEFKLLKGKDKNKDQSYFLWQLNQKQLNHILFPVGEYTKSEVRKLAKKFKLPTAQTPESQEVCFVQNTTNDFLRKYFQPKAGQPEAEKTIGDIVDMNNKIIGKHDGLYFFTIGQRKGIEVQQGPYFVVDKDIKKNILIVSKDQKDLEKKELIAGDVNWIAKQKLPVSAEIKIRYKSDFAKAKIFELGNKKIKIVFVKPQKAITPGQSAVFYAPVRSLQAKEGKGGQLLGGGVIE